MTGVVWIDILGVVVLAAALGTTVFWLTAYLILRFNVRSFPGIEDGYEFPIPRDEDGRLPLLSVIIPAHNEEASIGSTLESVRASDYEFLEIIVVADRCTDRTVEIVRDQTVLDSRVRLIEKSDRDPAWSGKCHACWTGYQHATGSWLLFTDADTSFHPRLVRSAIGFTLKTRCDALSIWGRLRTVHLYERFIQPVACMIVGRMFPPRRVNHDDPAKRRPHANGQFMLFPRHVYEGAGTHECVKDVILEDIHFARKVNNAGFRIELASAKALFSTAMYNSFEDFRNGWIRILIEIAGRSAPRLHKYAVRLRAFAAMALWPILAIPIGVWIFMSSSWLGAVVLAALLLASVAGFTFAAGVFSFQGVRRRDAILFPLACMIVAELLSKGAATISNGGRIAWGGQAFDVQKTPSRPDLPEISTKKTAFSQV